MGVELQNAILKSSECVLVAAIDRDEKNDFEMPIAADLVIDFSSDDGAKSALAMSNSLSAALLVGTTSLHASTLDALHAASKTIPILITSNASLGVAVMHRMAEFATRALDDSWRITLKETHHIKKLDFPSGTALSLAATIRNAGGELSDKVIESIREGDVVGDHQIQFHNGSESVTLIHHAIDRSIFARGAVQLGVWLRGKKTGLHTMQQWLDEQLRTRSNT